MTSAPHRRDRHQGGADLAAEQHPPGGLHRHLHLQRHAAPGGAHRPPAGDHRRLRLQQVVAGLDQEQVDAALEQPGRLLLVGVAQVGEADVAEARQLGAGTDRAGDPPFAPVGGDQLVGHLAGETAGGDVQLVRLVGDAVLVEDHGEAAEAGGLDDVDADVVERPVHGADGVGTGETEHLVAALERRAAEVVRRRARDPVCRCRTRRRRRPPVRRRHRGTSAASMRPSRLSVASPRLPGVVRIRPRLGQTDGR